MKAPYETMLSLSDDTKWLPLLDKFRTIDWVEVQESLDDVKNYL
jgi:hypothetical protein